MNNGGNYEDISNQRKSERKEQRYLSDDTVFAEKVSEGRI